MRHLALFVVGCLITSCDSGAGSNSITRSPRAQTEYDDRVRMQQDGYDKQAKRTDEQLQAQEAMQKRADALLVAQEQFLKRQQDNLVKFEKILETWETQQSQYQQYLDSLVKK